MPGKKKQDIEFQYYKIPHGERLLSASGEVTDAAHGRMYFHNLLEVGYCVQGSGELVFLHGAAAYGAGTVTVIPQNVPHATKSHAGGDKWEYLFFDPEALLEEFYPDNPLFARKMLEEAGRGERHYLLGDNERLAGIVRMIADERGQKRNYSGEYVRGLLLSLLACIAGSGADESKEPDGAVHCGGIGQIVRALENIDKNYMENLKMKELAASCNLSETHFRRLFVEYTGMTPSAYLNQVRIRQACGMIKKTSYSMEEVATRSGYASISSFNRNFRSIVGTSPYQYKKNSGQRRG